MRFAVRHGIMYFGSELPHWSVATTAAADSIGRSLTNRAGLNKLCMCSFLWLIYKWRLNEIIQKLLYNNGHDHRHSHSPTRLETRKAVRRQPWPGRCRGRSCFVDHVASAFEERRVSWRSLLGGPQRAVLPRASG